MSVKPGTPRNTPEHPRNTPEHPRITPGTARNSPEQPGTTLEHPWNTPGTPLEHPIIPRNIPLCPGIPSIQPGTLLNTKNSGQPSDRSRID